MSDDSPSFGPPTVHAHRADAYLQYSFEFAQDARDGLAQLRELLLDAKQHHEAAAWITGTGDANHQPTGLTVGLAGTSSELASESAATLGVDDVYALLEAVPARFRPNASWLASLSITNLIRRLTPPDGSETPLLSADESRLLMKPIREASYVDGTTVAGKRPLIVGDFNAGYVIAYRIGSLVEVVPHVFGPNRRPTGERGMILFWRVGGQVVNPNALRMLKIASA